MSTTTTQSDAGLLILQKVEKLWRKAHNSGSTPAEREAFEAKALSLMAEHRLTMAMLDIEGEDVIVDVEYAVVTGRYARVTLDIVDAVAKAYDVKVYWYSRPNRYRVMLFGFKSDVERTRQLARFLVTEGQQQAARERGYDGGDTFSVRRSFLLGFAEAIRIRLREASRLASKAVEAETAKGAELVLVSKRERVHEEFRSRHTRIRSTSTAPARSSGYSRGFDSGMSAPLGGAQRPVGNTKALSA